MAPISECLILAAGNGSGIASVSGRVGLPGPRSRDFEPKTAEALLQQTLGDDEVILAVDHSVDCVFDLDDATKVKCEGNHIVEIGKKLARYEALDTGIFYVPRHSLVGSNQQRKTETVRCQTACANCVRS